MPCAGIRTPAVTFVVPISTTVEPRAPGQTFFDTSHQKWSERKTNRSVVITGLFRRKRQGWGGSLKPSDLKMENILKKKNAFFKIVLRSQRSG